MLWWEEKEIIIRDRNLKIVNQGAEAQQGARTELERQNGGKWALEWNDMRMMRSSRLKKMAPS